jgi:cytochrome c-type biogenesis protein CcmE
MTDTRPAPPAPVKKPLQKRYIVAAVVCVGIAVWMLTVLKNNAVYLKPVSQAVAQRESQGTRRLRIGGTVVTGTIDRTNTGARFDVTEGGAKATVDFTGGPPDLFKDCAPVVVEGHWAGTTFEADRLLIRHGSEYDAKKRVASGCTAGAKP